MEQYPKVAVILLNWKGYQDTCECIQSLEKLTYPNFQVFVVDNDSGDQSYEKFLMDQCENKFHLPIAFIQSGANLGFAGGNNVAIKRAYEEGFEYFWMLNNDTVVEPESLSQLVKPLLTDSQVGIVGSKILYFGTNLIWFAGGVVSRFTGISKHIGIKEEDCGQFNQEIEVDYITGCSLLFRRELLETVGFMHEDFFLYFEETEWNLRAKSKGWKIRYAPQSVIYHKVSVSSGGESNPSPYMDYYDIRNAFVMIKRTQGFLPITITFLVMIWKMLKKHIKVLLFKQDRKVQRLKYVWLGFFDSIRNKMGRHPNLSS